MAIDNPVRAPFFESADEKLAFEENQWHFWNPGVVSFPIMPRLLANWTICFHSRIYSLWEKVDFSSMFKNPRRFLAQ